MSTAEKVHVIATFMCMTEVRDERSPKTKWRAQNGVIRFFDPFTNAEDERQTFRYMMRNAGFSMRQAFWRTLSHQIHTRLKTDFTIAWPDLFAHAEDGDIAESAYQVIVKSPVHRLQAQKREGLESAPISC